MKKSFCFGVLLCCLFCFTGCQTTSAPSTSINRDAFPPIPMDKPPTPHWFKAQPNEPAYYTIPKQIQCVPYAREVSGIPIRGNAHTWWGQAKGKYGRTSEPDIGAVMVLSKTARLKYGHLAVVKNIVDSRTIEVEHTNWGGSMKSRKIVYTRMPVKDISPNNDWSMTRFYNYPSGTFGRAYKVSGFILPNHYMAMN